MRCGERNGVISCTVAVAGGIWRKLPKTTAAFVVVARDGSGGGGGGGGGRGGAKKWVRSLLFCSSVRPSRSSKNIPQTKKCAQKGNNFLGKKSYIGREGRRAARFPFPPRLNPISCLSRTTRRRKMAKRTDDERANATHTNCPIRMNVCRSVGLLSFSEQAVKC